MEDTVKQLQDFLRRLHAEDKRLDFDFEQMMARGPELNSGLKDAELAHIRALQITIRNSAELVKTEINEFAQA